jgi:hypothetical protein
MKNKTKNKTDKINVISSWIILILGIACVTADIIAQSDLTIDVNKFSNITKIPTKNITSLISNIRMNNVSCIGFDCSFIITKNNEVIGVGKFDFNRTINAVTKGSFIAKRDKTAKEIIRKYLIETYYKKEIKPIDYGGSGSIILR